MLLLVLSLILFILMMVVGGERGALSFVTLVGNIVIIFFCIYGINKGIPILFMIVISSVLFIFITLFYQNGRNIKTLASMISVILVESIVGLVVGILVYRSKLAGYNEIEMYEENTIYLSANLNINMEMLMVAVILLSLLGAIMDTSISIASAMYEIHKNNEKLSSAELRRSGIVVGKDILGTTANTVFLAGIGETMMLTILMLKFGYTFEKLINSKAFFQEIVNILIANIGCIFIIPVTIWVISILLKSENKEVIKIKDYFHKKERLQEGKEHEEN